MGKSECLIFTILVILVSPNLSAANESYEEIVRAECGHTRYPTLCVQTLTGLRRSAVVSNHNVDLLSVLVNVTIAESIMPRPYFESLTSRFTSPQAQLARMAFVECEELMEMSLKRLKQAMKHLRKLSPEKHKADIQTWLSAALTFQETCKDTIEEHMPSNSYMESVYKKMEHLSQLCSNSLGLVNRITRNPGSLDRESLLVVKANAVVAKDGSGDYKTIGEAMKAATGDRFVIYVKSGKYNEQIECDKDGITLIGDGKYSTVISAAASVGKGSSLRGSATFTITGDGFIARDIGFENTAGPDSHQAVALTISSDHSVLYRCSIAGYQDTLYAHSLRQFYRECDIYGTVDFIFGNAAAVFQSCTLILRRPRSGGAFNSILANGRTDPGQSTGFSVQNCRITVGSDFMPVKNSYNSYLGRPWKAYSRAVVMQSNIDGEITGRGWMEWEGAGGSTYRTLYFGEYGNMGPGGVTSGRVNWPGFHVLGTTEATKFTVADFIGGNSWLPSTGVTFVSGL